MITEKQLHALCKLLMTDDPSILTEEERKEITDFADFESAEFGYANWIQFYHNYQP